MHYAGRRNHSQKARYIMVPFLGHSGKCKTENRLGWGGPGCLDPVSFGLLVLGQGHEFKAHVGLHAQTNKNKTENRSVVVRSWSWKLVLAPKEPEEISWGERIVLYCGGGCTTV